MSLFKKLLVIVTEASDPKPAFEQALELAGSGGELTLLDIADPVPEETQALIAVGILDALETASREERVARLLSLADEAGKAGIAVRTKLATGSAYRIAIREALGGGYGLLLKTVDARHERSRSTLGSTDKQLLRMCPIPVWLTTPDRGGADVLAAVDPNPHVPEEDELSVDIVNVAAAVAAMHGEVLHVLHAWKVFGEPLMRGRQMRVSQSDADHILSQARERHNRLLDDLLSRVNPAVTTQQHLVHGPPSEAIIDFVSSRSIRLLVMGTVGRTGIPGLVIGNTAERVLSEVTCSVLALKPRGFVSPVHGDA